MKYMDNRSTIIQKYPSAFGYTFYVVYFYTFFRELVDYSISDGFELYFAFTGKDYKIIGEYGKRLQVKDKYVFGFLVFCRFGSYKSNFLKFNGLYTPYYSLLVLGNFNLK